MDGWPCAKNKHVHRLPVCFAESSSCPTTHPYHEKVYFTCDYVGPVGTFMCRHQEGNDPTWVIGCGRKMAYAGKRHSKAGKHSASSLLNAEL